MPNPHQRSDRPARPCRREAFPAAALPPARRDELDFAGLAAAAFLLPVFLALTALAALAALQVAARACARDFSQVPLPRTRSLSPCNSPPRQPSNTLGSM
jgi:hypothetical protein